MASIVGAADFNELASVPPNVFDNWPAMRTRLENIGDVDARLEVTMLSPSRTSPENVRMLPEVPEASFEVSATKLPVN